MSNWIDSGGHEPRQFCDAYAGKIDSISSAGGWKASLRGACALLLVTLTAPASHARDPDGRYAAQNPELHKWFEGLRSGKGPCCSDADGTAVADVDWESANGHYRVRLDGEWIEVPDEAVITEPNRIGRTMVWPIRGYLGISIRCFMPGSMT
ncbi:hypothetical protein [Bradyrhizobium sp. ARR65]|uniref:hypothetical protein n=1 Tax=Bradyrhizobium sp. ARR65 TaxID=1040989 RepID=UPI000465AC02|nr:hypothetical protein [Bradyrhizobium sp. ARR65]